MRKVSYVLLATLTLPIVTGATAVDPSWVANTVRSLGRPVKDFCDRWGLTDGAKTQAQDIGNQVLADTSFASIYYGTGLNQVDSDISAKNAEEAMNKSLQRGLAARFLGFKEGQPLPSLAASFLPITIGTAVKVGLSFIPGGAIVAHEAAQVARQVVGTVVQIIFKSKLAYEEAHCDTMTLTAIQSLSEGVAAGFARKYRAALSKLTQTQMESFVMYASISILDHVDHLLKTAKDGDTLTSKNLVDGLSTRYLKVDHGVPTVKTIKRKVESGLKRKRGFGAKTAGRILTNGLVERNGKFFIDESKLDAKRLEDGKKRGRLSKHRRLDLNYPRVLEETPDPKRYKPVTAEQVKEMIQAQKAGSVARVAQGVAKGVGKGLGKVAKGLGKKLKRKPVVSATAVPAA